MDADQVYEHAIRPLSRREKLRIARRIIAEFETEDTQFVLGATETGFDALKRLLPNIERIRLTDDDLANVQLNGPLPE